MIAIILMNRFFIQSSVTSFKVTCMFECKIYFLLRTYVLLHLTKKLHLYVFMSFRLYVFPSLRLYVFPSLCLSVFTSLRLSLREFNKSFPNTFQVTFMYILTLTYILMDNFLSLFNHTFCSKLSMNDIIKNLDLRS